MKDRRIVEWKAKKGKLTLTSRNAVKVVHGGPTTRPVLAGTGHETKPSSMTLKQVHPVSESMTLGWVWGRLFTSPVREHIDGWIKHPSIAVSVCSRPHSFNSHPPFHNGSGALFS